MRQIHKFRSNFENIACDSHMTGQNIYEFDKDIDPMGYFDPVLGLYIHVYDYYSQTSLLVYCLRLRQYTNKLV